MAQSYLDDLPKEVASQIALNRIVGAAEAASFCNYSLPHWRRLYRTKKVPEPVKLNGRKVGWKIGTLIAFNSQRVGAET